MKTYSYISITLLFLSLLIGCKQQYTITSVSGQYISVTDTDSREKDSGLSAFVNEYKEQLDSEMNKVVGHSDVDMYTGQPQSLLTNFTSDVLKQYKAGDSIDVAFMNVYGHRAPIAKGDVTVGNVYSTYSFDNTLVLIKLKGEYLTEVFEAYAKMGGAGISGNAHLVIRDGKLAEATLDGKAIDRNKIYTIITLDYLADGNNGMEALLKADSSEEQGIKLRDYILGYIKEQTAKGLSLSSKIDQRIIITK